MESLKEHLKNMVHPVGTRVHFPHNGKMKFGKVVRFDKGEPHGSPFYVVDHGDVTSAKVPAHKAERLYEETTPKFQRATKTDLHYTGTINGKTYVVPHSFEGDKKLAMRYAIVTSPTHVQHNNPTLKPEEMARVHQHIKDIHGGQESAKLEEETHSGLTPPSKTFKAAPENKPMYDLLCKAKREKIKAERPMRKGAADRFLRRFGESNEEKPEKGTPAYQAERDKYRHAALAASRKAATLAFAKKHHIINEDHMNEQVWHVTDHLGHTHEVQAKDKSEAMKKVVSVGGVHPQGIPMSQWGKVKVQPKKLEEMVLKGDKAFQKHQTEYNKRKKLGYKEVKEETVKLAENMSPEHVHYTIAKAEHPNEFKQAVKSHSKNFMATYHRNENANRHTANIVHLAKHFGDAADQAQAKFYHDELKKHGHNKHHEAQYELHKKLWPKAMAAHKLTEGNETMSTKQTVKRVLSEMVTRKHFQQVADVIKAHPDAAKRAELAAHHAGIFKAQNPRFDHKRFYAAANAGEPKV